MHVDRGSDNGIAAWQQSEIYQSAQLSYRRTCTRRRCIVAKWIAVVIVVVSWKLSFERRRDDAIDLCCTVGARDVITGNTGFKVGRSTARVDMSPSEWIEAAILVLLLLWLERKTASAPWLHGCRKIWYFRLIHDVGLLTEGLQRIEADSAGRA